MAGIAITSLSVIVMPFLAGTKRTNATSAGQQGARIRSSRDPPVRLDQRPRSHRHRPERRPGLVVGRPNCRSRDRRHRPAGRTRGMGGRPDGRLLLMNTEALILYAIFGLVAFGWRTWLQWRRTGDTGLRMHAKFGTMQWWAKIAFVAAILCGVAAPSPGSSASTPSRPSTTPPPADRRGPRPAGDRRHRIGPVADGRVMAHRSRRRASTPASSPTGVFGVVRNPIFTAMLITATGLALMVGNAVAVGGLVALVLALQLQVRTVEEPVPSPHPPRHLSPVCHRPPAGSCPCCGRLTTGL